MRTSKPSLADEMKRLATVDHLRRLVEEDAGPPVGGSRRWRCPIHDGDDPNFAVYQSRGGQPRWRCHSRCDKGGSIIDYLVAARGLSTKDAVHEAARIVGASTPNHNRPASPGRPPRPRQRPVPPATPRPEEHWLDLIGQLGLVDDLTQIVWLDKFLTRRRLTLANLLDASVSGSITARWGHALVFWGFDEHAKIRGWQLRIAPFGATIKRSPDGGNDINWCGGGPPEWWPHAERVIVVASPTDRLALIAAGHGHNPILAPFGDSSIRAAALHARKVWPQLPVNVVLDADAHNKGAKALVGIEGVNALGCTGSDIGEMWAKADLSPPGRGLRALTGLLAVGVRHEADGQ